jgi:TolB-like protein/DNA-binding winged helix-turn-helix (wHTH) protein
LKPSPYRLAEWLTRSGSAEVVKYFAMKAHAGGQAMPPERSGSIFVCGDLQIDVGRQRVLQAGKDLELPKLSFDVLLAMVRVAPNVLSINALMERVWAGVVVNPETVIQRISLVREALGDDSREPRYIGSLRARGYFLIPPVTDGVNTSTACHAAADPAAGQRVTEPVPDVPCSPSEPSPLPLFCSGGYSRFRGTGKPRWSDAAVRSIDADTVARTVAVMPFKNLSRDPDDAYLATGLPEMILNRLSNVRNLAVVARSSSFALDSSTGNAREIGRRLNSAHLVEGRVQRDGDRVRVTAQLIESSGTLVRSFDRPLGISSRSGRHLEPIAAVLMDRIADLGTVTEPQEHSANVTAHLSYFHGLSLLGHYTAAAAIPMFEKAIALDAGSPARTPCTMRIWKKRRLHDDIAAARPLAATDRQSRAQSAQRHSARLCGRRHGPGA